MKNLKRIFPISFIVKEKNTNMLIRSILLYAVFILAYSLVSGLLGFLLGNLIAWLLGFLGTAVGLYCTVGIVLSVLCYCGIIE